MAYEPSRSTGYMLNLAARVISQQTARLLAPLGVAPAYMPVIFALVELGQCTQAELADRVSIEPPTMARTLSRMERDGLIARSVDAADRRRAIVQITDHAQSLVPQIEKIAFDMNDHATSGLPPGSDALLLDILGRIVENLRDYETSPSEYQGSAPVQSATPAS